ncbi:MAG: serine/threonine-protein kinase [Polyangiales bacterium]
MPPPPAERCVEADDLDAFLTARLPPSVMRGLELHLAQCAKCRRLLSALAPTRTEGATALAAHPVDSLLATEPTHRAYEPPLAAGTHIDRYVVRAKLGEGGMGVVYVAHDSKLDRNVALKLLRAGDEGAHTERGERLRREARVMARLAHPNVVMVHDVGELGDRIFVAMELVEGDTLARWCDSQARGLRDVLAAYVQAGSGLAAAHEAGIVHGDFKPENVFVGRDGRVRVGDFGLAQLASRATGDDPSPRPADLDITTSGLFAGTPRYMAPEQLRGERVDARSDQFSFCVSLHIAVVGAHPFEGDDPHALADALLRGRMRRLPRVDPAPRWLRRALTRGLSVDPAARFSSMAELLAVLQRDRARWWIGGGVAASALVASALLVSQRPIAPSPCAGAARHWEGVWDAARAQRLEASFAATGVPYATRAAAETRRGLDGYRDAWVGMHTDACEATRVRGEQSDELLDKRMLCLDARLRDVRGLVGRFTAADKEIVARAPRAVAELEDLSNCADSAALSSQVPPAPGAQRAQVTALRGALSEVRSARLAGVFHKEGLAEARALRERVRATGYRPLEAEALYELGAQLMRASDFPAAKQAYTDAVWAAEAGRDDALAARAWLEVMEVDGIRLAHGDAALALVPRVTALLARSDGDAVIEGRLHMYSCRNLRELDRFAEGRAECEKALAIMEKRFEADSVQVIDALLALGAVVYEPGAFAEARGYYQRALAIADRLYGDAHPEVARAVEMIARTYTMEHRDDDAAASYHRALAIYERALGPTHATLGMVSHNLSLTLRNQRRWDEALAMNARALRICEAAYGRDHPTFAKYTVTRGSLLMHVGEHREALARLEEALRWMEAHRPKHSDIGMCLTHLANLHNRMGKHAAARAAATRGVEVLASVMGPTSGELLDTLVALGEAELGLGRPRRALAALQRAHALPFASQIADAEEVARVDLLLARAEAGSGDLRGGRARAQAARARLADGSEMAGAIDRWLAARRD